MAGKKKTTTQTGPSKAEKEHFNEVHREEVEKFAPYRHKCTDFGGFDPHLLIDKKIWTEFTEESSKRGSGPHTHVSFEAIFTGPKYVDPESQATCEEYECELTTHTLKSNEMILAPDVERPTEDPANRALRDVRNFHRGWVERRGR